MPLAPHAVHSSTEPPDKVNLESAYDREMQRTETEILKILESSQTLMRVLERKERRHDTTRSGPRKNPAAKLPPAPRTPSRPTPSPRDASHKLPTPASLFPSGTCRTKDKQQRAGADIGAGEAAIASDRCDLAALSVQRTKADDDSVIGPPAESSMDQPIQRTFPESGDVATGTQVVPPSSAPSSRNTALHNRQPVQHQTEDASWYVETTPYHADVAPTKNLKDASWYVETTPYHADVALTTTDPLTQPPRAKEVQFIDELVSEPQSWPQDEATVFAASSSPSSTHLGLMLHKDKRLRHSTAEKCTGIKPKESSLPRGPSKFKPSAAAKAAKKAAADYEQSHKAFYETRDTPPTAPDLYSPYHDEDEDNDDYDDDG
jgi:hypothetical protein